MLQPGGALTGVASIDTIATSATALTFAGAGTISSTTSSSINLDSGSTGAINIGTGANAKTITIGNTTGATALILNSGSGNVTLGAQLITAGSGIEFTESDTNPTCASGNYSIYADTSEGKLKKCQNGVASDLNAVPDMNSFTDTTTEAVADNDTTNYWDGTAPNITPKSTTSEILVMMTANIASSSNTDTQITLRIMRHTSAITCQSVGTAVGGQIGTFQGFGTAGSTNISTVFVDTPGTASNVQYALCSDADSEGAVGTMSRIDFTLFEINDAADLAEIYSTNDSTISMGDVVSFDYSLKSGVKKSEGIKDKKVIGIVSSKPAMVIGGTNSEGVSAVPVALSGRVPVKVTNENGAIEPGDYLTTSSTPGVAMKSLGFGVVIGQAMSSYDADGVGIVTVFVKNFDLGNFEQTGILLGDISKTEGLDTLISTIQSEDARDPVVVIGQKISEGKEFFMDFVSARVTAIRGYFDEIFTKKVHTEEICVKKSDGNEICVNGDQINTLLNNANITPTPVSVPPPEVTPDPVPTSEPAPTPESAPETNPTPEVSSESASTPEPIAVPPPEVTPDPVPTLEPAPTPESAPVPEQLPAQ